MKSLLFQTFFMNYLQFDFKTNDEISADTLVALLAPNNFEGFEEDGSVLKAFIREGDFDDSVITDLKKLFSGLAYERFVVENVNWNAEWEANFQPVVIDEFVGIRAHFHPTMHQVTHEIIITPKMSFGTGHHATTHMMVQLMRKLDFTGKTVLDFGTGTGLLAILAKKLGAAVVTAIDNDEWSINNAAENFDLNDTQEIELIQLDTIQGNKTFDILLANINLNIILKNIQQIANGLTDGGVVLMSGFYADDIPVIKEALLLHNLQFTGNILTNNWTAVSALRNQ